MKPTQAPPCSQSPDDPGQWRGGDILSDWPFKHTLPLHTGDFSPLQETTQSQIRNGPLFRRDAFTVAARQPSPQDKQETADMEAVSDAHMMLIDRWLPPGRAHGVRMVGPAGLCCAATEVTARPGTHEIADMSRPIVDLSHFKGSRGSPLQKEEAVSEVQLQMEQHALTSSFFPFHSELCCCCCCVSLGGSITSSGGSQGTRLSAGARPPASTPGEEERSAHPPPPSPPNPSAGDGSRGGAVAQEPLWPERVTACAWYGEPAAEPAFTRGSSAGLQPREGLPASAT
ncbi:unnamed protein product [Pleuronectes platessa]|uniref:Uncharacterized protein n=1 Tax=Pleuronectes platessa TaxID=8262 RepID=A0A9N7W353_PLEPL|nr:unnamed protein product [Pleuronectes platessa]